MGNTQGTNNQQEEKRDKNEGKQQSAPPPVSFGKRKKKILRELAPVRIPTVMPSTKCRLRLLKLERIKDYLLLEEEVSFRAHTAQYITNKSLHKPLKTKNQDDLIKLDDIRGSPMSVGTLEEIIDENHAIVTSSIGPEYYVNILSFVDKDLLEPGCSVLLHNKTNSIVGILLDDVDPLISVMKVEKAPLESYDDIGGLEDQIQEIKEAVELPLTRPELYDDIGIKPPKGVILYGPPGTGKTLLAKAVANETSATFLRVVGSELIQKYLGDGPKLVREMFKVAEDNAPSIIFIDEIDAIGTKRLVGVALPQVRRHERRRARDPEDDAGAAEPARRLRLAVGREGDHGHQQDRVARPGAHTPGPDRPEDRAAEPGLEDQAEDLRHPHLQDDHGQGRGPGRVRGQQGRPQRRGHQGHVHGGGAAGAARAPDADHAGRPADGQGEGAVPEKGQRPRRAVLLIFFPRSSPAFLSVWIAPFRLHISPPGGAPAQINFKMPGPETPEKDPYDEAENKVRKSIRKAILLQSQLYDNAGKAISPSSPDCASKTAELSSICSAIESDIGELQKVIHAINQNPGKYRISKTLLDSRQRTIHEFRSKVNGIRVHSRQVPVPAHTSYGADYSNVQLQHQQDVLNQQNHHLTQLHGTAETLHDQAVAFNEEVKSQNRLLRDVEGQMVESQLHISMLTKKLSRYLDTNNPSIIRLILILSVIVAVLVVVLIVF